MATPGLMLRPPNTSRPGLLPVFLLHPLLKPQQDRITESACVLIILQFCSSYWDCLSRDMSGSSLRRILPCFLYVDACRSILNCYRHSPAISPTDAV